LFGCGLCLCAKKMFRNKIKNDNYVVEIDSEACCQCGHCVSICPSGNLEMGEKCAVLKSVERCVGCTQCTAVCPTRAIHAVKRADASADQPAPVPTEDFGDDKPFVPMKDFARHVAARRSVRKFKPEAPSREVLDGIIQASRYAPTACNFRKIKYAVIADPQHINALRDLCLKAFPMATGRNIMPAPAVLLVINELGKEWYEDAVIAATTFDLVARSAGVACTFAGVLRRAIENSADVRKFLREECGVQGLDDHPVQALYLGYPAEEASFLRPAVRAPAPVTWA